MLQDYSASIKNKVQVVSLVGFLGCNIQPTFVAYV